MFVSCLCGVAWCSAIGKTLCQKMFMYTVSDPMGNQDTEVKSLFLHVISATFSLEGKKHQKYSCFSSTDIFVWLLLAPCTVLCDWAVIKRQLYFLVYCLLFINFFFSPEGLGVVTGAVFLIAMFLFIPFPFLTIWFEKGDYDFPHHEVSPVC